MSNSAGYNCTTCNKWHAYSMYVMAHFHERLQHSCDLCGAVHMITGGVAFKWAPGHLPAGVTRAELDVAAGVQLPLIEEPQLTDWVADVPPQRDGFYHIRFPNGTEADRNWHWYGAASVFQYDKGSPIVISFGSIGAWRGLDREYN